MKITRPKLIPNKLPLTNTEPSGEELRYYLSSEEYNELLAAVLELIDDYNEKLASGWGGGGTVPIIKSDDNIEASDTTVYSSLRSKEDFVGIDSIIKSTDDTGASDTTLYTSLMTLVKLIELKEDIQSSIDALDGKYLSKVNPDTANELITFLKGLEVTDVEGKDKINITPKRLSFQHEGELGWGDTQYYIDSEGYAHLKGLLLEESLEVPELRYNRIEINVGDSWRAPGGGVILDVVESSSTAGTVTLKLNDGELGAVSEDDLCMGIYHFMGDGEVNNAAEDKDDFETGEREIKGFATSYFQILTVSEDHTSFTYRLRPGYTVHPQPAMNFVSFGNTTNKNRQASSYQTRTYQRYMINRDDWSYTMANISAQFGDLTTLGGDYDEYSAYLNNVYFTGKIEQLIADKIEVRLAKEKISVEKNDLDQYILGPQITNNVLSIMEGDRLLTPTNNTFEGDLKAGEYFINIEGVNITPGEVSINTVDRNITIGDSSNMTADIARIMYNIKIKRANGKSESIAKYQEISFLKGIPGEPGEPGNPGDDGAGIASVVLKHAFSTNGDSKPFVDTSSNWITGIPTNTSSQKGKYLWVQTITTYTKGIPTTYSYTVSYIPKDGENGTDGTDGEDGKDGTPGTDGTDSVSVTASKEGHTYTFYSTNSLTPKGAWSDGKSTLSVYKGTQKLTYTTGVLGDTNYTVTVTPTPNAGTNGIKIGSENSDFFVYPEKLPTDTINIILTVKVKVKGITEKFTKVLTYSRLNDGVSGVGVPIVYRGLWDVTKTYYGNDKRMDIVKYDDHYWKAKNITGSSTEGFKGVSTRPGNSSSHWDSFGAEFESVATELLLAEEANIAEFSFKNQAMYSQNGWIEDPLGVFTEVTDSGGDINNPLFKSNLYLNGKTGELQARTGYIGGFKIDKDKLQSIHGTTPSIILNGRTGKLTAKNADIKGKVTATEGSIGGFNIVNDVIQSVLTVGGGNPVIYMNGRTGAGHVARGNISWDGDGKVTFGSNVTLSWSKITDAPTIPEGVSDSYIKSVISDSYIKGTVNDSYIKGIISDQYVKATFEEAIETDFATKITSTYITTQHINTLNLTSLGKVTAGSFSLGNGNFVVSTGGNLTAKNADISGKITATEGSIGGFEITDGSISSIGNKIFLNSNGSGQLASGNISWGEDGNVVMSGIEATNALFSGLVKVPFEDGDYKYSPIPRKLRNYIFSNNNNSTVWYLPEDNTLNGARIMFINWRAETKTLRLSNCRFFGQWYDGDTKRYTIPANSFCEMIGVSVGTTFQGWLVTNTGTFI